MNKGTVEPYKFQQIQMITAHMTNRKKTIFNLTLQLPNALIVYLKSDADGAMTAFFTLGIELWEA
jgi:hypothetical protein